MLDVTVALRVTGEPTVATPGETDRVLAEAVVVPVPVRLIVCVEPGMPVESSVIVIVPDAAVAATGVNTTLIQQL